MLPHRKTAEFFRSADSGHELADGRILSLHDVKTSQDVHYPTWEMHAEGDELLVVASGKVSVEYRDDAAPRVVSLSPQSAFIVPAGVWHRLLVHEPSVLIAITPRHGTAHEPG